MTEAVLREALSRAVEIWKKWGLHPELAARLGLISVAMQLWGATMPDIISGYRSPAKTRKMQQAWDRGDREGLRVRPSDSSWHMHNYSGIPAALAVDVNRFTGDMDLFRALMMKMPYTQNPANDDNHFEVELPLHAPGRI